VAATVSEPITAEAPDRTAEDDVLRLLHTSLVELTEEFRTVVNTVTEQGAETRALLEAQTTATGLLIDAIRMLPRQLEAAREPGAASVEEEDGAPRIREPIELLRPEVVRFDEEPDQAGGETWAAPGGRHRA
jgi:hypothetical protein